MTEKITFGEMRAARLTGVLIYCSDHRCSHWTRLPADRWPDDVRLSDIEPRFVCGSAASAVLMCGRIGRRNLMAESGWSRPFDDPIDVPGGGKLRTLRDAGHYIAGLPKKEQSKPHWQTAAHELMTAAERGGIVMFAHVAMVQAIGAGKPEPPPKQRRKRAKRYRIVR